MHEPSAAASKVQQEAVKTLLNERLLPLLKDEWKQTLSLFDAGAWLKGDTDIAGVVVFMRSYDLPLHLGELLGKELRIDSSEGPFPGVGTGLPALEDKTVTVRLVDMARARQPDLYINLFQAYEDEESAENGLSQCNSLYEKDREHIEKILDSHEIDEEVEALLEEPSTETEKS